MREMVELQGCGASSDASSIINRSLVHTKIQTIVTYRGHTVADPGFPIGGANVVGGADSRGGLRFKNCVCQHERIWTLRGAPATAPWIRQCHTSLIKSTNTLCVHVHVCIIDRFIKLPTTKELVSNFKILDRHLFSKKG